jgi:hypothetical protein
MPEVDQEAGAAGEQEESYCFDITTGLIALAVGTLAACWFFTTDAKHQLIAAVLIGISLTLLLGAFTEKMLRWAVTVPLPKGFHRHERGGGGPVLGLLERVLFFVSFWPKAYVIAGGWLAFKVAAKWSSWQHVFRVDLAKEMETSERNDLASRLLGRFLLGTLYNLVCAAIGMAVAMLLAYLYDLPFPMTLG